MRKNTLLRYDLLQRYRLIEIVALWEGRLNANHLRDYFGIGRQQASKDINEYCTQVGPGNLVYNNSLKGYEPTDTFCPQLTSGLADEYLQLISRNNDLVNTFADLSLGFDCTHQVPVPVFNIDPTVLRAIITASRKHQRLEVDYRSVNAPDKDGRIIAPHSIVHSGLRWYVRAFCEKNQDFRDFVLTRFHSTPEVVGRASAKAQDDEKWNTLVNVCFTPDKRLTPEQKHVVATDYGMTDNRLLVQVRGALVQYLMQLMRVEVHTISADPRAQQIVIENMDGIKRWLFD